MAGTGWRLLPYADPYIVAELFRRQKYCPGCGSRLDPENCVIFKREEISTSSDDDLKGRLTEWRNKKGEELGVNRFQSGGRVISNAIIDRLVDSRPNNVDELLKIHGMGEAKVREFGTEILDIIGNANPSTETEEDLSQQLDKLMLFCGVCNRPQDRKPGSQIVTPSGGIECVIIRVDTGEEFSGHFHVFP